MGVQSTVDSPAGGSLLKGCQLSKTCFVKGTLAGGQYAHSVGARSLKGVATGMRASVWREI